jgi:hypothetical protein
VNEDIIISVSFMATVIVLVIAIPLVRAHVRNLDRRVQPLPPDSDQQARLVRIENAVESMSIELERIAEGQRFVTKLMAERAGATALPHDRP